MHPNQRIKMKLKTMFEIAVAIKPLSTCKRQQVAAVIFPMDFSGVPAIGYSGPCVGRPNDSCEGFEQHLCGCSHAEENALVKSQATGRQNVMLTTNTPCVHCAGMIANSRSIHIVIACQKLQAAAGMEKQQFLRDGKPILHEAGIQLWDYHTMSDIQHVWFTRPGTD